MLRNTAENKLIKLDDGSYVEAAYVFLHPSMPFPDKDGNNAYASGFLAKNEEDVIAENYFKDIVIGRFKLEDGEDLLEKAHDAAIIKWPQLEKCGMLQADNGDAE